MIKKTLELEILTGLGNTKTDYENLLSMISTDSLKKLLSVKRQLREHYGANYKTMGEHYPMEKLPFYSEILEDIEYFKEYQKTMDRDTEGVTCYGKYLELGNTETFSHV